MHQSPSSTTSSKRLLRSARRGRALTGLLAAVLLLVAACGSDDPAESAATEATAIEEAAVAVDEETEAAAEPTAEPVTEPTAEPAAEPTAEPAAESAAGDAQWEEDFDGALRLFESFAFPLEAGEIACIRSMADPALNAYEQLTPLTMECVTDNIGERMASNMVTGIVLPTEEGFTEGEQQCLTTRLAPALASTLSANGPSEVELEASMSQGIGECGVLGRLLAGEDLVPGDVAACVDAEGIENPPTTVPEPGDVTFASPYLEACGIES